MADDPTQSRAEIDTSALPPIVSGENDTLIDAAGTRRIDLFSAHGSAFLGHAHPRIAKAIANQLERLWNTGGLPTEIVEQSKAALASFFPDTHRVAGLYSTGMEAAEFAMRLARAFTGKPHVVGFRGGMHGKSLATASLGWDNLDIPAPANIHRVAFGSVNELEQALREHRVSAVFVEPIQASAGGLEVSEDFIRGLVELCRSRGALVIFDEILTGFWRTGTPFCFSRSNVTPDVILVGKAMAGGFPASAVIARADISVDARSLPGSTFAANALAAAAIVATLREFEKLDLHAVIKRGHDIITESFAPLSAANIACRGRGLLWVLQLPPELRHRIRAIVAAIYQRGVFVSHTSDLIRILPAATISPDNLRKACRIVCEEILHAVEDR